MRLYWYLKDRVKLLENMYVHMAMVVFNASYVCCLFGP